MLSYRHAFHAGNHADLLKHSALVLALRYLVQKEAPLWYIDTHAGAGRYRLGDDAAQKTGEYRDGIERIWSQPEPQPLLADYLGIVTELNGSRDALRLYPGSPLFAAHCLRPQDRLRLFERHPQDFPLLARQFDGDRRVQVTHGDGFAGLKALLPPPSRRALVLIDPPYEVKSDYQQVVTALRDAHRRFATGVYLLWYPLIEQADARRLSQQLDALKLGPSLRAELCVGAPGEVAGLYGSGLFVINPPWRLAGQLRELLPWLAERLARGQASWRIEFDELS
jgi:23S rRNA (adenine2030-N6)-methyltransferase